MVLGFLEKLQNLPLPIPRPTLTDHIRESALPPLVQSRDISLIAGTDDFDNAKCGFGPDADGTVHVAMHSRCPELFYHKCRCDVRSFQLPPVRELPCPQDMAGSDFGRADFLSRWMGAMMPAIGNMTLWDLCLPGTHDSLTYDLSEQRALGDTIPNLGPLELPPFNRVAMSEVRKLCVCQVIDIEAQLSAGIRFLDFRVIHSRGRWVGVHGMETQRAASVYLQRISEWLRSHPSEVVVLWLSRHGDEEGVGDKQYPNTPTDVKQAFYREILQIFGDLVVDHRDTPLSSTQLSTLVARNQRAVLICSDWAQFTGESSRALDARVLQNLGDELRLPYEIRAMVVLRYMTP